jgi:predicted GIY-YIG superfamily endonuclease
MYYVYILKWTKYYIWMTNNIYRRIEEHKRGNSYFTKRIWDNIELLWWFEYLDKKNAIELEKRIKKSWHIERYMKENSFVKMGW